MTVNVSVWFPASLQFHQIIINSKIYIKVSLSFLILAYLLIAQGSGSQCNLQSSLVGWEDCEGPSWYLDPSTICDDSPSMRSGPIENTGVSSISRIVAGPARIDFSWKIDADYEGVSQLSFLVDGDRKYSCDSREWKSESYDLREKKDYYLTWELKKIKSYPKNAGAGWIGKICVSNTTSDSLINEFALMDSESNITYVGRLGDSRIHTYTSINAAIQHVSKGGVVRVSNGIYKENIIIDKAISLVGEDKTKTFIKSDNAVVYIAADDVIIKGFTILGGDIGISVVGGNCNVISDNIISLCTMYGVYLEDCIDVSIINNNISDIQGTGIFLLGTYSCSLIGNMISDASLLGISIGGLDGGSYDNIINNNRLKHSVSGIKIASDSNWNTIGRGNKSNCYENMSKCDIYVENFNKSENQIPFTCMDVGNGCKKCSE